MTGSIPPSDRSRHLDALRGLAAMVVVSAHALATFFPYAVFGGDGLPRHLAIEGAFHFFPLSLFTAGHFAVCLFFVLSGYILAWRFVGQPGVGTALIAAAVKRPVRLGALVLLSLGLAALLWSAGLLFNAGVAEATGSIEWLGSYWARPFEWRTFIADLLQLRNLSQYNPPLWTIQIELIGSFLVFAVLLGVNRWPFRVRVAILVAAIIVLHGSFYQGFLFGILIADCQRAGVLDRVAVSLRDHRGGRLLVWLAVPVVLLLAAWPYYAIKMVTLDATVPALAGFTFRTEPWATAGAAAVLVFFLTVPALRRAIDRPWLHRLGDWSFAIYVLHFLVLGSAVCWTFALLGGAIGYLPAVAIAVGVGLIVLFPLAALATRWVDLPAIALANGLGRRVALELNRRRSALAPGRRGAVVEPARPILLVPGWDPEIDPVLAAGRVTAVPAPEPFPWAGEGPDRDRPPAR